MGMILNESFPLSRPLASAISVQQIVEIASANVRSECGGVLPAVEGAMIVAFDQGLRDHQLVLTGPLVARSVGSLLCFLIDLGDEEDLRTFYEEADTKVGGPIWALLSDGDRARLLKEGMSLVNSLLPIWKLHCDATPEKFTE